MKAGDTEEVRHKASRGILEQCKGNDALIFMSHGYPDRMDLCFRTSDLREWKTDLSPAILFNCACFNGAPGRWYHPKGEGYEDRGVVAREDSVALALLDSGITGYFAGVDMWHGPLNAKVFYYVADDGMRLGQAAKMMYDRLALEFLPGRIHFEPARKTTRGGPEPWVQNQRHNGAAMILYGDPALAPFSRRAKHLLSARTETAADKLRIQLTLQPLVDGEPGDDFGILPINRLFDYYSLRTDPEKVPPRLELYRVVPLPAELPTVSALRVVSAKSADKDVPTGKLQWAVENAPGGKLLHVRVPVEIALFGPSYRERLQLLELVKRGMSVELEGSQAPPAQP